MKWKRKKGRVVCNLMKSGEGEESSTAGKK